MGDTECLFCRIAAREVPAEIVGEMDSLVAFKDTNPQAPTHLLIIPKDHIPSLDDLTDDHITLVGRAHLFAKSLAAQHNLGAGYRVVVNCGAGAGQTVFHLHFHLLGGRTLRWPPG